MTIGQATLTVTASPASAVYGSAIPAFGYTVTGFVNGDTAATSLTGAPALSTTAVQGSPPGTYPITASAGSLISANYLLSFANGTLTISEATAKVIASPAWVVDESAPTTLGYTVTGYANRDAAAITLMGAPTLFVPMPSLFGAEFHGKETVTLRFCGYICGHLPKLYIQVT
jgi:hypothetical protein